MLHAAVRVGQPGTRRLRPVGDGGVQAAATLPQRRALQADLRHIHRLQEHCVKDCQRAQTVSAEEQRGEMRWRCEDQEGEGGAGMKLMLYLGRGRCGGQEVSYRVGSLLKNHDCYLDLRSEVGL